jgi:hypothetical protein
MNSFIEFPFCKFVQKYEMTRVFTVLMGLIFLISCQNQTPKGILSKEKMAALMVDVHLLDGYLTTLPIDSATRYIHSYYQGVFRNHKIDSIQFEQNLRYYAEHPQDLDKVYEMINNQMNDYYALTEVVLNDQFDEKRRLDSIAQIQIRDSLLLRTRDSIRLDLLKDVLHWRRDEVGLVQGVAYHPYTTHDWLLESLHLKTIRRMPNLDRMFLDPNEIPKLTPRPVPMHLPN